MLHNACPYLIFYFCFVQFSFENYERECSEKHEQPVAHVPKHHGEQKRKGDDRKRSFKRQKQSKWYRRRLEIINEVQQPTGIDFAVGGDPISVDDILKALREFVRSEVGRRHLISVDTVQNRWHVRAAFILKTENLQPGMDPGSVRYLKTLLLSKY